MPVVVGMKVIIAGGRDIQPSFSEIWNAVINSGYFVEEIVSGCADGVDHQGELYAENFDIPLKKFPANWNHYGALAGPIRNLQMARYADALIAFPGGKGTANIIRQMEKQKKPVYRVTS